MNSLVKVPPYSKLNFQGKFFSPKTGVIFLIVCCGRDGMVIWFTSNCAISAYHHWRCEFESHSWRGVLDTTSCDKVCQWLATSRWFSPVSSTNKTDHHDIAELLLNVALCRFLVVANLFRLETCMNSLVKGPPYSKLNFQRKFSSPKTGVILL
jgi:hypothetical protein